MKDSDIIMKDETNQTNDEEIKTNLFVEQKTRKEMIILKKIYFINFIRYF